MTDSCTLLPLSDILWLFPDTACALLVCCLRPCLLRPALHRMLLSLLLWVMDTWTLLNGFPVVCNFFVVVNNDALICCHCIYILVHLVGISIEKNSQHRIFRSRSMPNFFPQANTCDISGFDEIACSHISLSAPVYFTLSWKPHCAFACIHVELGATRSCRHLVWTWPFKVCSWLEFITMAHTGYSKPLIPLPSLCQLLILSANDSCHRKHLRDHPVLWFPFSAPFLPILSLGLLSCLSSEPYENLLDHWWDMKLPTSFFLSLIHPCLCDLLKLKI